MSQESLRSQQEAPDAAAPTPDPFPLRVAWVAAQGATERYGGTLRPISIGLMDELVHLSIVAPDDEPLAQVPSPPVEAVHYPRLHRWLLAGRTIEAIADSLRPRKVEVLHALDVGAAALARGLARELDVPYVVSSFEMGDGHRLGRLDERAAAVLAASRAIRDDLLRHRLAPAKTIQVLRPGAYTVRHATCFNNLRNSLAIVALGSLEKARWFVPVLECFATLRERQLDCTLFLIGGGRGERELRRQLDRLHLRGEVTLVDRLSLGQLSGIFKAADICIAPVPSHAFDMNTLLAMAAGVPVLAAQDGPSGFLIQDQTARLFPAGQTQPLVDAITALIDDRVSARALAERALEHLRGHYTLWGMVSRLAEVYRQAAGHPQHALSRA